MSSPDSEFERGFDAELRNVPLPDGLIERLRRAALVDDEGLDAALRSVPVPPGLIDRLRQAVLVDDEGLDAALREVPVPVALTDRLRRAVVTTDEGLDAMVRDVPVPAGIPERLGKLPDQLRRRPRYWSRLRALARWATAASLMIAIGLSYFTVIVAVLTVSYPASDVSRPRLTTSLTIEGSQRPEPQPDFDTLAATPATGTADDQSPDGMVSPLPELTLLERRLPRPSATAEVSELFTPGMRKDLFLDAAAFRDWGVLTAHTLYDDQPELEKVAGLARRGIDLPLVPGAHNAFLLRYGVHPFVEPARHPALRTCAVPLAVDTASYELTRRYLGDGRLPPAEAVRTEDFLAAVDYDFPQPTRGALALTTAGGPSPFGRKGYSLLQIGVQARRFTEQRHTPVHLVLAIDVSASMRRGGRLEMIRRALAGLVRRLDQHDRISLVAFSEDAKLLLAEGGLHEADRLLAAIESLSVRRATNLGAGLRRAYAVAYRSSMLSQGSTHVVLLTDGLAELDRGTTDVIERRLAEAAWKQITLEVVNLAAAPQSDGQLALFARAGGGMVRRAADAEGIGWALVEIITGRPQLVATDARLKVTFNPKTVLSYRLLGHEAKAIVALTPPETQADFHAGRCATALYEMQLKEGSKEDHIATVELSWQPPGGGQSNRQTVGGTVRRDRFARLFVQSDPSLQEAALVAQAAEVLRKSPFARTPRGVRRMAPVLELAESVDTRLYDQRSFREFIELVKQANEAKPYRSGATR